MDEGGQVRAHSKIQKLALLDEVHDSSPSLESPPALKFASESPTNRLASAFNNSSSCSEIGVAGFASVAERSVVRDRIVTNVAPARPSPFIAFERTVFKNARCLEIFLVRSPSLMVIHSFSSSCRSVLRFLVPFGRPFWLPDSP